MFVNFRLKLYVLLLLFAMCHVTKKANAKSQEDSLVLNRVFSYIKSLSSADSVTVNAYVRYSITVDKRNPTLLVIPTMYSIAKGDKEHVGETYSKITVKDAHTFVPHLNVNVSTIPHHRKTMSIINSFQMPRLYEPTLIGNDLLSPFNRLNRRLYKYRITHLTGNRSEILFTPKLRNTQMIAGIAIVDNETGRIMKIHFSGEHDMINFRIKAEMGKEGLKSLVPENCDIFAEFKFLGNKITTEHHTVTTCNITLPDSIRDVHDMKLMNKLRPEPLPLKKQLVYRRLDSIRSIKDTINTEKGRKKDLIWDVIGEHLISRIRGNFGTSDRGNFRISPILNPLYLGYSNSKGITYKMKIRGSYAFTANSDISLYLKTGYYFKQHQLYFKLPLTYTFNKRRNGYMTVEVGNGNRITNSSIVDIVKNESLSDIDWDKMHLDYFKDFYVKFITNYDFSDKISIQPGIMFHRRSAVDKSSFDVLGRPHSYHSFSPTMQIQVRPWGWKGVYLTTDYERGIKGVGQSSTNYERFELDASWLKKYHSLRSLSLRGGCGFYTSKSKDAYFLDYTNFRDENIPGGWNDDWTGDFQMLNSNWYNASEYYVRTNVTYEAPMMLLAHFPIIGHIVETERFYINTLFVKHLHPYVEYGYGFTNRFFSMGLFAATRNLKFDGVGCRFGFELFKDW